MDTFLINTQAGTRRVQENGRWYLVAPATILVADQVLNGSKGKLFYGRKRVAANVGEWNKQPIVLNHPVDANNRPIAAHVLDGSGKLDSEVIRKFGMGEVRNDHWNDADGKRGVDLWFDEEHTRNKSYETYLDLIANKPIELSTGLFTKDRPVANGRTPSGADYTHEVEDYTPDHLAILPYQTGACSREMGCGVNNAEHDLDADGVCLNCGGPGGKPGPCPGNGHDSLDSRINKLKRGQKLILGKTKHGKTWVEHVSNPKARHRYRFVREYPDGKVEVFHTSNHLNAADLTDDECKAANNSDERTILQRIKDLLTGNCGGKGGTPGPCKGDGKRPPGRQPKGSPEYLASRKSARMASAHADKVGDVESHRKAHIEHSNAADLTDDPVDKRSHRIIADHHKRSSLGLNSQTPTEGDDMPINRAQVIADLTTNCDCWKGKDKVLNTFDDDALAILKQQSDELKDSRTVLNSARETFGLKDLALNAMPAAFAKAAAKKKGKCDPDDDDDDDDGAAAPTGNRLAPINERLTPDEQEALAVAQSIRASARKNMIDHILTANAASPEAAKTMRPIYEAMKYKDLEVLVRGIPAQPVRNSRQRAEDVDTVLEFSGVGFGNTNNSRGDEEFTDDDLAPITFNAKDYITQK